MPRINNTDYRNRHAVLQADWEKGGPLLSQLTSAQQQALRAVYQFDVPLRAESFAVAKAEAIKRDESLIARAGLAYRAFARLKSQRQPTVGGSLRSVSTSPHDARRVTRSSNRRIAVFSEFNPDLEPEQIARIIIAMAQDQVRRERAHGGSDSR